MDNRILPSLFFDSLHGVILGSYDNGPGPENKFWFAQFTSDAGSTWNVVRTLNAVPLYNVQCVDAKHITIVGDGGYISHTSDGGITLHQQQSNTVNNLYGVCFGTVQAGTAVGIRGNILRITTDEKPASLVKDKETKSTSGIIIIGNYPNPFTEYTTIDYALHSAGMTMIKIYSIDGQEISSTANEFQSVGNHSIRFNAEGLSSGLYIFRIINNSQIAETQMLLRK
jgi:hypothetical protein